MTAKEKREIGLEIGRIWAAHEFQDPDKLWKSDLGEGADKGEAARARFRFLVAKLAEEVKRERREAERKAKRLAAGKTWGD